MNKIYLTVVAFVLAITMNAQDSNSSYYYYYKNQKVYLTLDKSKVNIFTSANFQKNSISNLGFEDFVLEDINGVQSKKVGKLESAVALSDAQFLQKLTSLRQKPQIKNVGLYFKTSDYTSVGTSNLFYVKLNNASDYTVLQQLANQKGVQIERQIPNMPLWYVISVNNASLGTALDMSNEFYETELFADIDPAFMFEFASNPETSEEEPNITPPPSPSSYCATDPDFHKLWPLYHQNNPDIDLNACDAWEITEGSGIKIAIIDSGIQTDHPDLQDNIYAESYDCLTQTSPAVVYLSHGTRVAGLAAAIKNNDYPMVGVAPQSTLMAVSHNFLRSWDIAAQLADGIAWAWQNGADIINNSWGVKEGTTDHFLLHSSIIEEALVEAMTFGRDGKGSVVVFAAGNEREILYPGNFHPGFIVAGAINKSGERAYTPYITVTYPGDPTIYWWMESAFGPELDIVAPGQNMLTTQYGGGMAHLQNVATSYAAPQVAGVAALMLAVNPCLTRQEVSDIIEQTAQKNRPDLYTYENNPDRPNGTWHERMGYGLLDADAAVQAAQQMIGVVDLMIKDSVEDAGSEPNTDSSYPWASPNIWVRNQPDGIEAHLNPIYHPTSPNYVYVRVTNKSCTASQGGEKVKVYWSKIMTYSVWEDDWNGENTFGANGPIKGQPIGEVTLPVIQADGEVIVQVPWMVPHPSLYLGMSGEAWQYSLLARIESDYDIMTFSETQNTGQNVAYNNNIAQKSVTVINSKYPTRNLGGVIAVGPTGELNVFNLNFISDDKEEGTKIFEEAEVWVVLDDVLLDAWLAGGKQGNNIVQRGENLLMITGDDASLNNLNFQSNEIGTLYLHFNFLTKEVTEKTLYTYHVVQKNSSTGEIIGGTAFEINKDPRALFYADGGGDKQVDKYETIVLSAETIGEPAVYNWYDNEGNLIFEGAEFEVSVAVAEKYKLEIIALADGFKDYVEIDVELNPNTIKQVSPNPAAVSTSVVYKINKGESAYLSVTGFYGAGSGISNNYILNIDQEELTLDLSTYPQGMYAVALIVDGQISDTSTLIKQ
ncbi:MAG: S8 family serine peptidase [Flavobacteriaceae bacterium]